MQMAITMQNKHFKQRNIIPCFEGENLKKALCDTVFKLYCKILTTVTTTNDV